MSRWMERKGEERKEIDRRRYEEKKRNCLSWVEGRRIVEKYRMRAMRAEMQYVQKGRFVKVRSVTGSDEKLAACRRVMETMRRQREMFRDTNNAMVSYWKQLDRLKELSGDVSREQQGTRVQREAKEAKWLDTVIGGMYRRSVGMMRLCSAKKKKVLMDAIDSDMAQVLSVKGQLFRKFVAKYR